MCTSIRLCRWPFNSGHNRLDNVFLDSAINETITAWQCSSFECFKEHKTDTLDTKPFLNRWFMIFNPFGMIRRFMQQIIDGKDKQVMCRSWLLCDLQLLFFGWIANIITITDSGDWLMPICYPIKCYKCHYSAIPIIQQRVIFVGTL